MVDKTVDARGLSCPEPVLLAMEAINELQSGVVEITVDTVTSCENVTRMAKSLSCAVEVAESEGDDFVLRVTKG